MRKSIYIGFFIRYFKFKQNDIVVQYKRSTFYVDCIHFVYVLKYMFYYFKFLHQQIELTIVTGELNTSGSREHTITTFPSAHTRRL